MRGSPFGRLRKRTMREGDAMLITTSQNLAPRNPYLRRPRWPHPRTSLAAILGYLLHPHPRIHPSPSSPHTSFTVILGLDPRTHDKEAHARCPGAFQLFLKVGPRVKPEDDGEVRCREPRSATLAIIVASSLSLMVSFLSLPKGEPRPTPSSTQISGGSSRGRCG